MLLLCKAFADVYEFAQEKKVDMRTAALALALKRVAAAVEKRGY